MVGQDIGGLSAGGGWCGSEFGTYPGLSPSNPGPLLRRRWTVAYDQVRPGLGCADARGAPCSLVL